MGTRTQAQRDAITVEIGYALVTAAFLAAALFCLIGAPVVVLGLRGDTADGLLVAATAAACLAFAVRVARVLWRFTAASARTDRERPGRAGSDA